MNKSTRTIATAAVASIAISVPLYASTVFADNHGRGRGNEDSNSSQSFNVASSKVTLTPAQYTAIAGAHKTYLTTVAPINQNLRTAMQQVQTDVLAAISAPSLALAVAQDAYQFAKDTNTDTVAPKAARDQAQQAYLTALATAKAAAKTKSAAANDTAQVAITKAKTDYQTAVTAAFPAGTVIAKSVLTPPRTSFNWMHSNDNWNEIFNSNGLALGHFKD